MRHEDRPQYPRGLRGIAYGGDYNPEQWPEEIWEADVALMRQAGVNLVSLGIFAWATLEPGPGNFTFDWMDQVLDLLHAGGIRVNLATPTASPPAWMFRADPLARSVDRQGIRHGGGARQCFCPSSETYAAASRAITQQLAARYADHPALAMWHVHNEYGGFNPVCYCDRCGRLFRRWLADRYGSLEGLNASWGTTFWGQGYGDWDEIEPPRNVPVPVNPALELDYLRFANHLHLANYRQERQILRAATPQIPITTNFMITNCRDMDYWRWADEVDLVSNDHYLRAEQPENHIELAMCADLTRAVAGGDSWLLMEHSTSAVNWQPRNIAKRPGELARNSLSHLGRGADGLMFFQWRASAFGGEKFHSAMLPHGGTDTRIWREVVELGQLLKNLPDLRGTRVESSIALIWDWEAWWALELPWQPTVDLDYRERVEAYYAQLWKMHLTCDFAQPEADLSAYQLVVVPSAYLMHPDAAKNLASYVEAGGTLVVSYFTGIVDPDNRVYPGGHPGALREVLGLTVEEFLPLRSGEKVTISGTAAGELVGQVWAEDLRLRGAQAMHYYLDGPAAGQAAVTRYRYGQGIAWYVSTRLDGPGIRTVLQQALEDAQLPLDELAAGLPKGVELIRRSGPGRAYLIAINQTDQDVNLPGTEPGLVLRPGQAQVIRSE